MNLWLSAGLIFTYASIVFILLKWGNIRCVGVTPVRTFTFIAILFTSGLDVGLIMFPLTEFPGYADTLANPEYAFANPLAIEFGFWGMLIWSFYFLTCFYFCIVEPRVKFFDIPWVKFVNNVVIVGTCAFTAYLLLSNLPWYLPQIREGDNNALGFYLIVLAVISAAVYSSTNIKYVRILSLSTTWLFFILIAFMFSGMFTKEGATLVAFLSSLGLFGDYFTQFKYFLLPINDYHEFYLYWWFAWSIMIGQFTARFVGGLRTYQLLAAMMLFPSIPIAAWFAVLYFYHAMAIDISGTASLAMAVVGIIFVVNSLDSLIRLYTDNLNVTVSRFGKLHYVTGNIAALAALTLLFKLDFLKIQWVGAIVIALFFACTAYIVMIKAREVKAIDASPKENDMDFSKIESVS